MPARKERRPQPGFFRGLFLDNLALKLTSLVAAFAIFSVVRGAEPAQRAIFVDVVAVTPSASSRSMLTSELPAKVRLTISGSRSILNAIRADDIPPVQIDLTNDSADLYYFEPELFNLPGGVEVTQIAPPTIPLTWARRGERSVPVVASFEGSPGAGLMMVGAPEVNPPSLTLRGAEPDLEMVERVATEPIALVELTAGVHERRVGLTRLPPHVENTGDSSVIVTFEIAQEMVERSIPRLDVAVVGGEVRELRPHRVRVILRGPPRVTDALDVSSIVPYVDATTLTAEGGAQPLAVRVRGIPDGVSLVRVEPTEVLATPLPAPHH